MARFSKSLSTALSLFLLIAFGSETVSASFTPQQPTKKEEKKKEKKKKKKQ